MEFEDKKTCSKCEPKLARLFAALETSDKETDSTGGIHSSDLRELAPYTDVLDLIAYYVSQNGELCPIVIIAIKHN